MTDYVKETLSSLINKNERLYEILSKRVCHNNTFYQLFIVHTDLDVEFKGYYNADVINVNGLDSLVHILTEGEYEVINDNTKKVNTTIYLYRSRRDLIVTPFIIEPYYVFPLTNYCLRPEEVDKGLLTLEINGKKESYHIVF